MSHEWRNIIDRLNALEETNSYLAAVITEQVTVGEDWVVFDSFEPGPVNWQGAVLDMRIADDGSGILILEEGSYFAACNFHLFDPTGDGEIEPALNPIGVCVPTWPDDSVNKGHNPHRVDADRFTWNNYQPGVSPPPLVVPCLAGDIITPSARFLSADGSETVDVKGLLYVWKVGHKSQEEVIVI